MSHIKKAAASFCGWVRFIKETTTADEAVLLFLALSVFCGIIFNIAVILLTAVYALVRRRQMFRERTFLSGVFAAFWVLSVTVTAVYGAKRMVLVTALLAFGYITLIFISYAMTARVFDRISAVICAASVPCLIVALIQRALGMTWAYGARYCSVFYNANFYGMVAALTVMACVYNMIKASKSRRWIFYSAMIAVNCVGIYLTASRVALVVSFIGSAVLLAVSGRWRGFMAICMTLALLLALDNWMGPQFDLLPRMNEMSESVHGRYSIWMTALGSIEKHPLFGVGTFSYGRVCQETGGWFASHAHNLFLEITLDYGYTGLILLSTVVFYLMSRALEGYHDKEGRLRMAVAVAVCTSVLISGFLDLAMLWPQTTAVIAFAMNVPVPEKKTASL